MRSVFILQFLYLKLFNFRERKKSKANKFVWLSLMFCILIVVNTIEANESHISSKEKWWQKKSEKAAQLFEKQLNYLDENYIKINLANQTENNEKNLLQTLDQLNNETDLIAETKNQTKSTSSAMSFILDESEHSNEPIIQVQESKVDLYDIPISITILLSFMYIMVSLIAVFGNLMVFYIVLISKRMRNVTNLFIANLALADILIGSLAIPFQFTAALLQRWVLPSFLCSVCPTVQTVSLNVSIFTLTAISIDRHRAITKPLANKLTKSKANIIIIFIWLFSLILALPTFLSYNLRYIEISKVTNLDNQIDYTHQNDQSINSSTQTFRNKQSSSLNSKNSKSSSDLNASSKEDSLHVEILPFCDVDSTLISDQLRRYYNHVLVFVQFFLPLFIICYCYIHMAIKLNSKDLSTNARNDCQRALQVKRRVSSNFFF